MEAIEPLEGQPIPTGSVASQAATARKEPPDFGRFRILLLVEGGEDAFEYLGIGPNKHVARKARSGCGGRTSTAQ